MGFNKKKFMNAPFHPRTEAVKVPELAGFFEEGKEPAWEIRNLTGIEVGRTNETAQKNTNLAAIVEAISGSGKADKVKAIKDLIGAGDGIPGETAKRTEAMVLGSLNPKCDYDLAALVRDRFPGVFQRITDKIFLLTAAGAEPGKLKGSGKTPASEPR